MTKNIVYYVEFYPFGFIGIYDKKSILQEHLKKWKKEFPEEFKSINICSLPKNTDVYAQSLFTNKAELNNAHDVLNVTWTTGDLFLEYNKE